MLPTWFLSMWISNTASTAMMIAILSGVLHQLQRQSAEWADLAEDQTQVDTDDQDNVEDSTSIEMQGLCVDSHLLQSCNYKL